MFHSRDHASGWIGKTAKALKCVGLVLLLAHCSGTSNLGPASEAELQAQVAAASAPPKLHPGERIKVIVFGEDRLSGEYEIDPSGQISIPLAGTMKAAGLTQTDLERELARKFRNEYLKNPKVTVQIASLRPFYIMGEVEKPGSYPYRSGLNALSAIALAGGTTYRGSRNTILIQRQGDSGMREYPLSASTPVLPGDLVRIPERYF
jgi:polysaccharide export outer membrane protein